MDLDVSDVSCPSSSSNPLAKYDQGIIYFGGLPHPRYSFSDIIEKVDVIVNLMEETELQQKGDYRPLLSKYHVTLLHFPIPDRTVPSREYLETILTEIRKYLGKNIYIHCLGGNGRSALVAAALVGLLGFIDFETLLSHLQTQHARRSFRRYEPLSDPGQLDFLRSFL